MAIGANLNWLVWGIIGLLFIIAWPISKVLDVVLGEDHGTYYKRTELKELLGLHSKKSHIERGENHNIDENWLTDEEVIVIKGALDMQSKIVKNIEVPIEKALMIQSDTLLDENQRKKLYEEGYSRVIGKKKKKNSTKNWLFVIQAFHFSQITFLTPLFSGYSFS